LKNYFLLLILIGSTRLAIGQSCCSGGMCMGASANDHIVNGLQSMLSVRYTVTANSFLLPSLFGKESDIRYRDYFQQLNFSGRWNVKDRVALSIDMPFSFNKRVDKTSVFYTGLGDIAVGIVGQVPTIKAGNTKHKLFPGFSIQAPTGQYQKSVDTAGFSPLIQAGTGAWLVSPSIEYVLSAKDFSFSAGINYRYAFANPDRLQIGGRIISWVKGAYAKQVKENKLIPSIAIVYEHLQKSKFRGDAVSLSGGQLFSTELAFDIRIKQNWGFACKYRQPIYQTLSKGYLKQKGTGTVQFNYFF
jgi:hypothetical protein